MGIFFWALQIYMLKTIAAVVKNFIILYFLKLNTLQIYKT